MEVLMCKRYMLFGFLFLFMVLFIPSLNAQQILDSANVLYIDNTSDNNTGTIGTFMNDPRYKEFPQTQVDPSSTDIYGFWSNNSVVYWGGNHRRASRFGSGNNTGAHVQWYCTVYEPAYYLVYHHMYSGNSTTNAYVKFYRFGEPMAVDSFRYNMLENNVRIFSGLVNGLPTYTTSEGGSWKPLGLVQLFPSDSALTVELGLDSLSGNTLRADAIALVRSTQTGPDLEFGSRRFSRVYTQTGTGDTIWRESFYKDRARLDFTETTFKGSVFTDKKIQLYNLGAGSLIVNGFTTQTNRFSVVTSTPFTILPGGKQEITIRFDPLGEEVTLDTLTVFSNDPLESEATLPLLGTGINYNFILNASAGGTEPHWNVPTPGGIYEEVGAFLNSTATPWFYPIPGGNLFSRVNTGSDPNIGVFYKFNVPDSLTGNSFFLEYSGPAGSSNAAQNATVDVVTPFYVNPNPALGDTQRVTGINLRGVQTNNLWVRFGGNKVFTLNGGGQTVVRMTNPNQGADLLRADLLRVRLVPIAPTISTSLDDDVTPRLLSFGSVSIYDSIRLAQFNYQKSFIIGSNGETPLRIDTIYLRSGGLMNIVNLPTFPITLPAIDGELNLVVEFLPDSIRLYTDSLVIISNDPDDSLITVRVSGQGVGTGITVDDSDPTTYIFPPDVQNWVGTPDPANLDKWYRISGSGINLTRMFAYIYFNPPTELQSVEWYPEIPRKPGSTTDEPDSFDVFVQIPINSTNSTPTARYRINHFNGITDTIISQYNRTLNDGKIPLGRYTFLRGGRDSHGSGTVYGSVYLLNDTALVSAFYQDSLVNTARQDSHLVRADALILEQAGIVGIFEPDFIPLEFSLSQNYPNPFNPVTQIRYTLPQLANVSLKIYDILGREVKTLVNREQAPGAYRIEWNGTNNYGVQVSSGMYIYRVVAGKFVQTKKMMFLK